jgi:hypothetical protein
MWTPEDRTLVGDVGAGGSDLHPLHQHPHDTRLLGWEHLSPEGGRRGRGRRRPPDTLICPCPCATVVASHMIAGRPNPKGGSIL